MITTIVILSIILAVSILVNINQLRKQESQSDYIEDCAKMMTSLEGYYDLIVRGYYDFSINSSNTKLAFQIDFDDLNTS